MALLRASSWRRLAAVIRCAVLSACIWLLGFFGVRLGFERGDDVVRELTLDDIDLPSRRISIAGHRQPMGELTRDALLAWLDYRHATWPGTASRHVLITRKGARGTGPVSASCLAGYLGRDQRGVSLEHIRRDRILQEALATGADPLHLALVFNIDRTNAMAYAGAARNFLTGPAGRELSPHRPA